ncbi:CHAD domain-containing protein [Epibacterium sp. Ofav1-8]|uniref:CHAD domain-containing protein n=1 Tax=Epibacterium sp. Ofav1-8 TaxID=2917735 RepID=UPI001EF714BA|nr:CHAD domain-containing protein [Epibacterium sp. Ofav1-8]MCG7624453.1 CHAD domain-containing protein [Epibacterium sp. Ofav1-8]
MTSSEPIGFLLDGQIDWSQIEAALAPLRLVTEPDDGTVPFRLLDCHDQLLRGSGRVLLEFDAALALFAGKEAPLRQAAASDGDFPADLPDGPIRSLTQDLFPLRCFLTLARGVLRSTTLRVVDEETKTQLRGEVLQVEGEAGGAVTLVLLKPLRGYDRAPAAMAAGLREQGAGPVDAERVFAALAPEVQPYVAKPKTTFTGQETAFDVAVETMSNYIAVARANEAGVIADLDTEFLHDYRVALRKLRSVLSLFKGVFGAVQTAELKAALSDLMQPTGRVRDLDVYLMERADYDARVPEHLRPGLSVMFDAFAAERADAQAALANHLNSKAYHTVISELEAQFAHPEGFIRGAASGVSADRYARKLIWKRYRKICKIAARIHDDTPDEEVHELRIACKKFRYLVEFFAPLFAGKSAKRIIKRMKLLQDNLGAFNDYAVQQQALLRFVETHPAMTGRRGVEAALSIGALIALLDQGQRAERARVMESFDRFNSPEARAEIKALCHPEEAAA